MFFLLFPRCCPAAVWNWNWEEKPAEEELSGEEAIFIPNLSPVVAPEAPRVTQPEDILLCRGVNDNSNIQILEEEADL